MIYSKCVDGGEGLLIRVVRSLEKKKSLGYIGIIARPYLVPHDAPEDVCDL